MGREAKDPRIDHDHRGNAVGEIPMSVPLQRCASMGEDGIPMDHYVFNPNYKPVTVNDIMLFGPLEICSNMGPDFFNSLTPLNIVYPDLYRTYLVIIRTSFN